MQRSPSKLAQLSRRQFLTGVGGVGLTGVLGASAWSGTDETPWSFRSSTGGANSSQTFRRRAR